MGTINYKTSDFITIGYNCNNIDYEDDFCYDDINIIYDELQARLNTYNFYYFNVRLEPGYYEGFTIDIELNYKWCFNDSAEKKDALKEVAQIKRLLLQSVNDFELCAVYPGWCTAYCDYNETNKKLNEAIKEMRATVSNTPTYYTLKRAGEL